MCNPRRRFFAILPFILVTLLSLTMVSVKANLNVFRVYNSSTGEHLYTSDQNEASTLAQSGWNDEGTGWVAPDSGDAVFRLYNPAINDHLYTTDTNEVNVLTSQQGWKSDFNGQPLFYSGGSVPVYRLYNASTGRHHLTTDENEYNVLGEQGWNKEGAKLLAIESFKPSPTPAPSTPSNSTVSGGSYESIINDFKALMDSLKASNPNEEGLQGFYWMKDFDGNGTDELVLGNLETSKVYNIYTLENGNPKTLFSVSNPNQIRPEDALDILQEGAYFGKTASDLTTAYQVQGTNLVPTDYYYMDFRGVDDFNCYHSTDPNNLTQTEIDGGEMQLKTIGWDAVYCGAQVL